MKFSAVAFGILLMGLSSCNSHQQECLIFSYDSIYTVKAGRARTVEVIVKNVSDKDIHMLDYVVDCACTSISLEKYKFRGYVIKPGASEKLLITVSTKENETGVRKEILCTLKTTDIPSLKMIKFSVFPQKT